jgi:CDP-2,3-bis-(O-geranylgeranyl)-sn-glycerol synthase
MWPLLLLIVAVNGAPLLMRQACRNRWAAPVDLGLRLADGRRLFGATKTWRGLGVALLTGMLLAPVLGLSPLLGLAAGGLAMAGDLLSSFAKRRLGLAPGSRAPGLDVLPEALLPALALMSPLHLTALDVLLLVMLFILVHSIASRLLYRLRIRRRPW